MSSDRDDPRDRLTRSAPQGGASHRGYVSDIGPRQAISEIRIRHLAEHLASFGRLNIYVLSAEWGMSPGEVVAWLSALHAHGRFERLPRAPYFRVVPPGRNPTHH